MPELTTRQMRFINFYLEEERTYGASVRAARKAGYGTATSSPQSMATIASRLMRTPEIERSIAERLELPHQPTKCAHCGSIFEGKRQKKYCSAECFTQARLKVRKPMKLLRCPTCYVDFHTAQGTRKYCSAECVPYQPKRKNKITKTHWVKRARAALKALEELGIDI